MGNYNKRCAVCEKFYFVPHVHHIDGNIKNNQKKNLLVICPNCHFLIHHPKKTRLFNWKVFLCNNLNYAFKQKNNNIYHNYLRKGGKKVYI